ncbi:dockerin type I domain-containing protein [Ruminococcus flavefaciens]|uniref:dockerin type I domain-containing protein n=1 Tax=Ruminococcus flavefaciens TaxID=1265 RepID=UPI0026F0FA56|nr:dockerin type I domain-containing protein [Ruminococcus flavefaciens]
MKITKIFAAALALSIAGGSLSYSMVSTDAATVTSSTSTSSGSGTTAVTAASASPTTTTTAAAVTKLTGQLSESRYYEFRQGSDDNVMSLSVSLYDDQKTVARILNFDDYVKDFDYSFEFSDKNVVVLGTELIRTSGGAYIYVKLKFPENTPLREYSFKVITKKAVDKNGKDITSAFRTYTGSYSILDKDGNDTGRPDPSLPKLRYNQTSHTLIPRNSGIHPGDTVYIGDTGYTIGGNINGKKDYFKEFDFDVEFDDKNVVLLEKKLVAEAERYGSYTFYPTVRVKIPENTPKGSYKYKITVNKATDLNGNDVKNKLIGTQLNNTYYVAGDENSTPATTVKASMGDPNGDGKINAVDASDILSVYAAVSVNKSRKLSDAEKSSCDVNNDGAVNAIDASYILSYYAYTQTSGKDSFADYMKKH